jgi:hypothetical protein
MGLSSSDETEYFDDVVFAKTPAAEGIPGYDVRVHFDDDVVFVEGALRKEFIDGHAVASYGGFTVDG